MDIVDITLESLEKYFIYIYPGVISLFIFNFSKSKTLKTNQSTLIISIVLSYIYVILYKTIRNTEVKDFGNYDYVVLTAISIILPTVWHWISCSKWFEKLINKLGFNTSIEDNVWDYIRYRDKDGEGIILKIFLDNKDIMYEGCLRYHESDLEKEQYICLSNYRRYIINNGTYVIDKDTYNNESEFGDDASRWVLIKVTDVTRVEIKYADAR